MVTGTELTSDERGESNGRRTNGRASAKLWVATGIAGMVISGAWLKYSLARAEVPPLLRLLPFHKSS